MNPTLSEAALKRRDESVKIFYDPLNQRLAKNCFDAGYIFAKEESNLEIENLKMVCHRLSMAKTIEKRNEIRDKCRHLFEVSVLREEGSGGMSGEQLAAIELEHRLANAEKEISILREENERLKKALNEPGEGNRYRLLMNHSTNLATVIGIYKGALAGLTFDIDCAHCKDNLKWVSECKEKADNQAAHKTLSELGE